MAPKQHLRGTALVTGASGGVGEQLARVFAAHGHDLVLVARGEAKLAALGDELARRYRIATMILPADLSEPEAPERIVERLESSRIVVAVLANNAGFATYGQFAQLSTAGELDMLQVNVVALTHLTRLLLPGMIARHSGASSISPRLRPSCPAP